MTPDPEVIFESTDIDPHVIDSLMGMIFEAFELPHSSLQILV